MKNLFKKIFSIFSPDLWQGTILGVILSAIFSLFVTIFIRTYNQLKRLTALKRLLRVFAKNEEMCAIFTNEMFTDDRTYYSESPNYFPLSMLFTLGYLLCAMPPEIFLC